MNLTCRLSALISIELSTKEIRALLDDESIAKIPVNANEDDVLIVISKVDPKEAQFNVLP